MTGQITSIIIVYDGEPVEYSSEVIVKQDDCFGILNLDLTKGIFVKGGLGDMSKKIDEIHSCLIPKNPPNED